MSEKCLGLVENFADFYPEAEVATLRGPLLSQCVDGGADRQGERSSRDAQGHPRPGGAEAAKQKARLVVEKLWAMKLAKAGEIVQNCIDETLNYYSLSPEHWRCLRMNNPLERLIRGIRRRTRVVGAFLDGSSALMQVATRLRYVASTRWKTKRYLQIDRLAKIVVIARLLFLLSPMGTKANPTQQLPLS